MQQPQFPELEEIMDRSSHKIIIINGDPQAQQDLADKLTEQGYTVEEIDGPDLSALPSEEEMDRSFQASELNPGLLAASGTILEFMNPIIQQEPNALLVNYQDIGQQILVYRSAEQEAASNAVHVKVISLMPQTPLDDLIQCLEIGRATRLFAYNFEDHTQRFAAFNCDPRMTIGGYCSEAHQLLADIGQTAPTPRILERLKQSLRDAYIETAETKHLYTNTIKEPTLAELEFKLKGVYKIIFGEELYVAELAAREALIEQLRTNIDLGSPPQDFDPETFLQERMLKLPNAEYLDVEYHGYTLRNNLIVLIPDGDQYEQHGINVDVVEYIDGSARLPFVDTIPHPELRPVPMSRADEFIEELSALGLCVIKVLDKSPNTATTEEKIQFVSLRHAYDNLDLKAKL